MKKILEALLDFIFPPNPEELELRALSTADIFLKLPPANPPEFPFITSLFSYRNPLVKELIWQIKYKKDRHALELAGFALYKELAKYENILLIPVPISTKRRRERGFNQCELIIDAILRLDIDKKLKTDFFLLTRIKNIEKQTFKNKVERIGNTRNIFALCKEINRNTNIIIIDDVSTTGSTLKEIYDLFKENCFANVKALTVAH